MSNSLPSKLLAELIGTFAFGEGNRDVHRRWCRRRDWRRCRPARAMNPAVTVGVLAAGAMSASDGAEHIVAQLIGGVVGALLLAAVLGGTSTGLGAPALAHNLALGATTLTIQPGAGFLIEAVLAFFLVTIVLSTAVAGRASSLAPLGDRDDSDPQHHHGRCAYRRRFHPARALGPMLVTGNFTDAWLYVSAPIVGAILASMMHTALARLAQEGVTASPVSSPAE